MKHKIHLKSHLICPKALLLIREKSKNKKYDLSKYSMHPKTIFKREKIQDKERIFKFVKDTKRNQVRKEQLFITNNTNQIKKYISALNNAHIDEGIVLNKYFSYLKTYNTEYELMQSLNFKNSLIPIKKQEKLIKNMKKSIKFYKSISNHMLMKYMIENKDKLNQYMEEKSSYKKRASTSYNYSKKLSTYTKDASPSRTYESFSPVKTHSNFYKYKKNNKKSILKNKLKLDSNILTDNGDFDDGSFSRKQSNIIKNRKISFFISTDRLRINEDNKYNTPLVRRKFIRKSFQRNTNHKNSNTFSINSNYNTMNNKFNKVLSKFKNSNNIRHTLE